MRATIAIFLLGWLAGAPAQAAAADSNYEVEVLVFQIRAPQLEGSELWTRIERPVDTSEAVAPDGMPASEVFTAAADALRADERFRVLLQKRWVQRAASKSNGRAVLLRTWDDEIDGTLRFYRNRFMHVELNLLFQPAATAIGSEAAPSYLIREERRIRSKRIDYFDHPKFGALVRVTPAEG